MAYVWVVTSSKDFPDSIGVSNASHKHLIGVTTVAKAKKRLEDKDFKRERWRCLDDDENVTHGGFMISNGTNVQGFEPLDDYCMPDVGATHIQYWEHASRWVRDGLKEDGSTKYKKVVAEKKSWCTT